MRTKLGVAILSLALAGGGSVWGSELPNSCGSDKVKFDVAHQQSQGGVADAEPGKAQIVFIESLDVASSCIGCDVTARIGVDGQWAGANKGNSYFVYAVAPGSRNLCASWQSRIGYLKSKVSMASLVAEPGKTYYYKISVSLQSYGFDLVPVSEDEAKYRLKNSLISVARQSH